MNDFLDCCKGVRAERDDARLEADRLRAELARLARERDGATSELAKLEAERAESARVAAERDEARADVEMHKAWVARILEQRAAAVATADRLMADAETTRRNPYSWAETRRFIAECDAARAAQGELRDEVARLKKVRKDRGEQVAALRAEVAVLREMLPALTR